MEEPIIMPLEGLPIESLPVADASSMIGGIFAMMAGMIIAMMVLMIFMIIVNWKLFEKAGFKGYESLIPGHNFVVMIQIAGKPISYFFLMLIPFANIYYMIKMIHGISKSFGKGAGFTWGLVLLPIIFLPMLVWGDAEYRGVSEEGEIPQGEPIAVEETVEAIEEVPQAETEPVIVEEAVAEEEVIEAPQAAEPVIEEQAALEEVVEMPVAPVETPVVPPAVVLPTQEPPVPPSV